MPPIENRISNESRADDEGDRRDSFRGSQDISETRRHTALITVYVIGAVLFLLCALQLCRRTRHFFQVISCNMGATRRERGIEEGPRTPARSRRPSEEGKEDIHHRRFLKKTLMKMELEQYQEAHHEWLQRLEEREKRAHEHQRDLNKKERHLLRVIRKLKGRPRVTLEDRHREQRLEDLESILEKRHARLEVLQKEVNESLGTYLRIRAQHSEDLSPQVRTRADSRASIDPDRVVSVRSSHEQSKFGKKLSRPTTPRKTPDYTPQTDQSRSGLRSSTIRIPTVSGSDPVKLEERRVSLLDAPSAQPVERKSTVLDPSTVLKSSLKTSRRTSKAAPEDASEDSLQVKPSIDHEDDGKISENEKKNISSDSKPPAPRRKSEDQSKSDPDRKSESKSQVSKKTTDDTQPRPSTKPKQDRKSDPDRTSESKSQVSKKTTDDTQPKPSTKPNQDRKSDSKPPGSSTKTDQSKSDPDRTSESKSQVSKKTTDSKKTTATTRKSETKPPENERKSTTRRKTSTSATADVGTTKRESTAKSDSKLDDPSRKSEDEEKSKPDKNSESPDED